MAIWRPSEGTNRIGDNGSAGHAKHVANKIFNAMHDNLTAKKNGEEIVEKQTFWGVERKVKTTGDFYGIGYEDERLEKENATLG